MDVSRHTPHPFGIRFRPVSGRYRTGPQSVQGNKTSRMPIETKPVSGSFLAWAQSPGPLSPAVTDTHVT
ncbi:hypothetical protein GWI33_015443 [Rhynchophorus ferrugineus]|uniref:Uncharacterized protein n=1 Tax=Rhynchophorus ferrugineus TaxID=354439 RepID=A0A834HZ97_RHYFE|nr:hypothetical protein GWI33_015443 [Rhynchophorus ferrugineus]